MKNYEGGRMGHSNSGMETGSAKKSKIAGFGSGKAGGSNCCPEGDKIVGKKPGSPIMGFSNGEKSGKV